ncbi:uncharacterized protein LOC132726826 isoform X2 [Ruditapes philippinarum]|uniref:uncharacterized protein LOC132726826 isoform X2 n=1 Tax=Ruditapes philippinarum TaxID=129788 RepID=UPI00295BA366|nr:uncharacterized protein LOC132726826 isoform X2 [Ruditapes philippinarum]
MENKTISVTPKHNKCVGDEETGDIEDVKNEKKGELTNEVNKTDDTFIQTEIGRDCLTAGWTLEEQDLLCLLPVKKSRQEEYKNQRGFLKKCRKPFLPKHAPGDKFQTSTLFESLIHQMRDKIEDKGLVPHDVYPDGNCLFSAIVDQLRVQGDFSFTPHTLRQSAVNYLRRYPATDDGTSLSMFLSDGEDWESYLLRISEDGEWGDHIILGALANVVDEQIVIFGGATGDRETVLYPRSQTSLYLSDLSYDLLYEKSHVVVLL